MSIAKGQRRTWQQASHEATPAGWQVRLDQQPLRTPAGHVVLTQHELLAQAIAAEWHAAPAQFMPADHLPLTQLFFTCYDQAPQRRDRWRAEIVRLLETDLLRFWVSAPAALAELQRNAWGPPLAWFMGQFGVRVEPVVDQLKAEPLSAAHRTALAQQLQRLSDAQILVAFLLAGASGSAILALALVHANLDPAQLVAAAMIEFEYQQRQWGQDPVHAANLDELQKLATLTAHFLQLQN